MPDAFTAKSLSPAAQPKIAHTLLAPSGGKLTNVSAQFSAARAGVQVIVQFNGVVSCTESIPAHELASLPE